MTQLQSQHVKRFVKSLIQSPHAAAEPISRDAVVWAYRPFLDRQPESAAVVDEKFSRVQSTQELRREFLQSGEYRQNHPPVAIPAMTGHEPPQAIEEIHDEAGCRPSSAISRRCGSTWARPSRTGRCSPQIGSSRPTSPARCTSSTSRVNTTSSVCGKRSSGTGSILRISLLPGIRLRAGRVSAGWPNASTRCTAWTSPPLTWKWRSGPWRVWRCGMFSCIKSTRRDIEGLPKADVIYSVIVLQHNPPPIMAIIVRQFMKGLNPGGVAYFQLPTYRAGLSVQCAGVPGLCPVAAGDRNALPAAKGGVRDRPARELHCPRGARRCVDRQPAEGDLQHVCDSKVPSRLSCLRSVRPTELAGRSRCRRVR